MAKRDSIILRQMVSIALVAAAVFLSISLHRLAHPSPPRQIMVRDAIVPTLPSAPSPELRVLHSTDKILVQQLGGENYIANSSNPKKLSPIIQPQQITLPPNLQPHTPKQPPLISAPQTIPPAPILNSNQLTEVASSSPVDNITQEMPIEEAPASTYFIPSQFEAKTINGVKSSDEDKVIALTFDDGPWSGTTTQILDILRQNNILATFFWIGQNLQAHPQIAQQVVADGHAIGNHTWHHWYQSMNRHTVINEIDKTTKLIYETTGIQTSLFRPPGGVLDNGLVKYAQEKKYTIIMWSDDPMDYRPLPAKQLVKNLIHKAKPGCIVLLHDGGGNRTETVKALPEMIKELQQLGYRFVTVPELLEMAM